MAIQKWRTYLLVCRLSICTNQQSLKYLLEQRVGTLAEQKWLTKLKGYDFVVEYKNGQENRAANALSRRDEIGELLAVTNLVPSWLNLVRIEYSIDPKVQKKM